MTGYTPDYCWSDEELAPARGCMYGALLATLFWLPIVAMLWLVIVR